MVRIVSVHTGGWKVYVTPGFNRNHVMDEPETRSSRVNLKFEKTEKCSPGNRFPLEANSVTYGIRI